MTSDASNQTRDPAGSLLVVISGPSGVGKDAAMDALRHMERPWYFVVTATTRPRRPSETDGKDYIFLGLEEFGRMRGEGELLESAEVYGNWYGVPRAPVRQALAQGLDVLVRVDVQGAATIKKAVPGAVLVFMAAPSMEGLRQRLKSRGTESPADLERRTGIALEEMGRIGEFDYRVVNHEGRLDKTVECIDSIIRAERCRIPPRRVEV